CVLFFLSLCSPTSILFSYTTLFRSLLLLTVYGSFDVGRRKSKPIIYSLSLAVICTDLITYLQVMIMRANTNIHEFKLRGIELLRSEERRVGKECRVGCVAEHRI